MLGWTVWIHAADREGSGRPLVLPTVTLKVLAGRWDGLAAQNTSLWSDLKPFLPILSVFVENDLETYQGTKWVEEGWSFPVKCAAVAACQMFWWKEWARHSS